MHWRHASNSLNELRRLVLWSHWRGTSPLIHLHADEQQRQQIADGSNDGTCLDRAGAVVGSACRCVYVCTHMPMAGCAGQMTYNCSSPARRQGLWEPGALSAGQPVCRGGGPQPEPSTIPRLTV